jgi:hypothetical protein
VSSTDALDRVDGVCEVLGQWVFSRDGLLAGFDLDRAVAACGADEFLDGPTGLVLDPPGDG